MKVEWRWPLWFRSVDDDPERDAANGDDSRPVPPTSGGSVEDAPVALVVRPSGKSPSVRNSRGESLPGLSSGQFLGAMAFALMAVTAPAIATSIVVGGEPAPTEKAAAIRTLALLWIVGVGLGAAYVAILRARSGYPVPPERSRVSRRWLGVIVPAGVLVPTLFPTVLGYSVVAILVVSIGGFTLAPVLVAIPSVVRRFVSRPRS